MSKLEELSYAERKARPICTGVFDYFPDALAYVAYVSQVANEQHNPGEAMHWAKDKSIGRGDEIARHLADRYGTDTDKLLHAGKMTWRALEFLQRLLVDGWPERLSIRDQEQLNANDGRYIPEEEYAPGAIEYVEPPSSGFIPGTNTRIVEPAPVFDHGDPSRPWPADRPDTEAMRAVYGKSGPSEIAAGYQCHCYACVARRKEYGVASAERSGC